MGQIKKTSRKKTVSTTRPPQDFNLNQIEERLTKAILGGTLALYLLKNSRKPMSELLEDILDLEFQVGEFTGAALQLHADSLKTHGMLAGALSFIPRKEPTSESALKLKKISSKKRTRKKKAGVR